MTSAVAIGLSQDNGGGAVAPFLAGKNKILNSDFSIWQRGTSTTSGGFLADRWFSNWDGSGGTTTLSQQTFTTGTAPVAGYESAYFFRFNRSVGVSGGTYGILLGQRIEDVRVFAGQTVTVSYWAKADASRSFGVNFFQNFGSGGSSQVYTSVATPTLTTSWARYSHTITLPSISGKTIGSGSYLLLDFEPTSNSGTFIYDFWGVQLEAGSVATPFTTATGTLQGELAACQRYYWRLTAANNNYTTFCIGANYSSTQAYYAMRPPVTMRATPSQSASSAGNFSTYNGSGGVTLSSISNDILNPDSFAIVGNVSSGLTAGYAARLGANNTSAYIEWSAEL
jgi:Carbohydrate binding domain